METCPSCQGSLLEHGTHCPLCGIQARCKSCGNSLNAGVRFCVHCGTAVGELLVNQINTNGEQANERFNIIEVDRDTRTSRFRARVTDHAIDSLSKPLTLYLAGQAGVPTKRTERHRGEVLFDSQPLLAGLTEVESNGAEVIETRIQTSLPSPKAEDIESQRLRELFRERDGRLRLDEPQLKASGKLDYAQRLTYLFLYAHDKAGKESVLRTALNTLLEENNVYDPHATNWIRHEPALVKEADTILLNSEGRRAARKYLEEAFDSDRTELWLPGESTSVRSSSKGGAAGEKAVKHASKAAQGKRGRPSEVTKTFVPKWKALGIVTNGYSLLKNRSAAEQGIFGLWAIRRAVEEAKIVSAKVLSGFLYHAFEIKANPRTLENALKDEAKKKENRVHHIEGTKFQITPDGITAAEKIANLKAAAAKK